MQAWLNQQHASHHAGVAWAAYFGVYEAIKGWHLRWQKAERLSAGWYAIDHESPLGIRSYRLVCNPDECIRQRLVVQPEHQPLDSAGTARRDRRALERR